MPTLVRREVTEKAPARPLSWSYLPSHAHGWHTFISHALAGGCTVAAVRIVAEA